MAEASNDATERSEAELPPPASRFRWLAHRGSHLFALSGLAVAQPLLDVLGRSPDDLVGHNLGAGDIWLLTGLVVIAVPALLVAFAEVGRKIDRRLGDGVFLVLLSILGGLLISPWLGRLASVPAYLHLALAFSGGTALAALYARAEAVRQFLTCLVPLIPAVPIYFLFFTPVRDLILPAPNAAPSRGAAGAPAAGAPAAGTPAADVPIIIVLFDELPVITLMDPEGEIDPVLYPRFAELGRTSTWYRNATTPATLTWRSLPALVTGQYPRDGQISTQTHHPRSLFTWLPEHGYELTVLEPWTQVCPREHLVELRASRAERFASMLRGLSVLYLHIVLPESFDRKLPAVDAAWTRPSSDRMEDFREFLSEIGPERSQLTFLHSLLPHHPWRFLPSGKVYNVNVGGLTVDGLDPKMGLASARWENDGWAVTQAYQRHLLQVQATDRLVGELLDRLRQLDLFDAALLVVTADHGVSFRRGGPMRMADRENFEDIVAVPLFIKLPGQTSGVIDDRNVELIDVVPTIAEVLGLDPDWSIDGYSTLAPWPQDRDRKLVYHTPAHKFWVDATGKDKYVSLARKHFLFPAAGDPQAPYRIGPYSRELLGRPLTGLDVRPGDGLAGVIDSPLRYHRVDPAEELIPSRVTGHLELDGEPRRRMPLALAVNGVVEAVTLTRLGDGGGFFSFMVPEDAFRAGHNDLSLLKVAGGAEGIRLTPVELPPAIDYSLVFGRAGDPRMIRASDGRDHAVDLSRPAGQASDIVYEDLTFQVIYLGWARNPATGEPPERFLLFDDRRLLYAGGVNFDRGLIRSRFEIPGHEDAAFYYVVERRDIRGTVRIFALFADGIARPLAYAQKLEPQPLPLVRQ